MSNQQHRRKKRSLNRFKGGIFLFLLVLQIHAMAQSCDVELITGKWKIDNVTFLTTTVDATQLKFRKRCKKTTIQITSTKLINSPCTKCFLPCEFNGQLIIGDTLIEKNDAINLYESKAFYAFFEAQETPIKVYYTNFPIGDSDDKLQIVQLSNSKIILYTGAELFYLKRVL